MYVHESRTPFFPSARSSFHFRHRGGVDIEHFLKHISIRGGDSTVKFETHCASHQPREPCKSNSIPEPLDIVHRVSGCTL
jgi:hypothetical protein